MEGVRSRKGNLRLGEKSFHSSNGSVGGLAFQLERGPGTGSRGVEGVR